MSHCITANCTNRPRYGVNLVGIGGPLRPGLGIIESCGMARCFLRLAVVHTAWYMSYRAHRDVADSERAWLTYCSTADDSALVALYESLPCEAVEKMQRHHGVAMFERIAEIVLDVAPSEERRKVA